MIVRNTGVLRLERGELGPESTWGRVRGVGDWAVSEDRPGRTTLRLDTRDTRDRSLLVVAMFVEARLAIVELTYAIRRATDGVTGGVAGEDPWEVTRKAYHDAIVREWFQSGVHDLMYGPPPQPGPLHFRFPWGRVCSDLFPGSRGAAIEMRYDDWREA